MLGGEEEVESGVERREGVCMVGNRNGEEGGGETLGRVHLEVVERGGAFCAL